MEQSSKKVYTQLNYFGLFLLVTSIIVAFAPAIFPSLAPNGWEVIAWIGWGIGIFILAMIVLVITNLFNFFSKGDELKSESKSDISLFTILRIPILVLILMYPLTLL